MIVDPRGIECVPQSSARSTPTSMDPQKHSQLEFVPISTESVREIQNLNSSVCPTPLASSFYSDVVKNPSKYPCSFVVRCDGAIAGGMICKLEGDNNTRKLYIVSFGVYVRFRRKKIGSAMMKRLLLWCSNESLATVYLHVHTTNEDAAAFYRSFGFQIASTIPNYYRRLNPRDAYELCKTIE